MHNSNIFLVAKITQLCNNLQVCDSWYELDLEAPIDRRMEDYKESGFDQFSNACKRASMEFLNMWLNSTFRFHRSSPKCRASFEYQITMFLSRWFMMS